MSRYHAASRIATNLGALRMGWFDDDMDSVTAVADRLDWELPAAEAIPLALDGATVYRGFGIGEGEDWRKAFKHGRTPGGSSHSLMRSPALDFALGKGYLQSGASGDRPVIVRTTVQPGDVDGGETAVRWSGFADTPTKELSEMLYAGDTAYDEFEVVLKKLPADRYELEWESQEEGLGYRTIVRVLSAKDFGVPQARERAFFVGSKYGEPAAPKPFGSPPQARSVLLSFPPPGTPPNSAPCRARVVPARKPILRKSPFAGMLFNGQGRPINLDSVSGTLPASMGGNRTPIVDEMALRRGLEPWVIEYHSKLMSGQAPIEKAPEFLRRLTVAEAAAFQGFPRDFAFAGSQSSVYRQIGNAVPPPLARAVAESVGHFFASSTAAPIIPVINSMAPGTK